MKNNAIVANMGHYPTGEIDVGGLAGLTGVRRVNIKPQVCAALRCAVRVLWQPSVGLLLVGCLAGSGVRFWSWAAQPSPTPPMPSPDTQPRLSSLPLSFPSLGM